MRHLIDKRGLDKQPRANTPVYIEDMVPFNETILQTREKRFHLGLQRIILCLYNTIGLFTVNRKQAMLHLQFKHLHITLQRDPHGGPPVPMIEIEPQFVKSVLGMFNVYVTLSAILRLTQHLIELINETAIPSRYLKLSMVYRWFSAHMYCSSAYCFMPRHLRRPI
jgi:hypothetical protein